MTGEREDFLLLLSLLWIVYGAYDYSHWSLLNGMLEIQVGLVLQFIGMGGRFVI